MSDRSSAREVSGALKHTNPIMQKGGGGRISPPLHECVLAGHSLKLWNLPGRRDDGVNTGVRAEENII